MLQFKIRTLALLVASLAIVFASLSANLFVLGETLGYCSAAVYSTSLVGGIQDAERRQGLLAFAIFGMFYQWNLLCPRWVSDWIFAVAASGNSVDHPFRATMMWVVLSHYFAFYFAIAASVIWTNVTRMQDRLAAFDKSICGRSRSEKTASLSTPPLFRRLACAALIYGCFIVFSFFVDPDGMLWVWFSASVISASLLSCLNVTGVVRTGFLSFGVLGGLLFAMGIDPLSADATGSIWPFVSSTDLLNPVAFRRFVNCQLLICISLLYALAMSKLLPAGSKVSDTEKAG